MSIVQAYRRDKPYTHVFPDVTIKFTPNDLGHIVAEISDEGVVDRLLETPSGFRVYGERLEPVLSPVVSTKPAGLKDEETEAKYVITSGDMTIDLAEKDDEWLHAFAKANGFDVHHASKGNTIRNKIVEALQAAE